MRSIKNILYPLNVLKLQSLINYLCHIAYSINLSQFYLRKGLKNGCFKNFIIEKLKK